MPGPQLLLRRHVFANIGLHKGHLMQLQITPKAETCTASRSMFAASFHQTSAELMNHMSAPKESSSGSHSETPHRETQQQQCRASLGMPHGSEA